MIAGASRAEPPVRAVYLNIPEQMTADGTYLKARSIEFIDWAEISGWRWCYEAQKIMVKRGAFYTSCSMLPFPGVRVN
jgi:hypothetical protein